MGIVGEAHEVAVHLRREAEGLEPLLEAEGTPVLHALLVGGDASQEEFLPVEVEPSPPRLDSPEADPVPEPVPARADLHVIETGMLRAPDIGNCLKLQLQPAIGPGLCLCLDKPGDGDPDSLPRRRAERKRKVGFPGHAQAEEPVIDPGLRHPGEA